MMVLLDMKEKYPYASVTQDPLSGCPECNGTGEAYHEFFKNTFVCMCMTLNCAFMSDSDRNEMMHRVQRIRKDLNNNDVLSVGWEIES